MTTPLIISISVDFYSVDILNAISTNCDVWSHRDWVDEYFIFLGSVPFHSKPPDQIVIEWCTDTHHLRSPGT